MSRKKGFEASELGWAEPADRPEVLSVVPSVLTAGVAFQYNVSATVRVADIVRGGKIMLSEEIINALEGKVLRDIKETANIEARLFFVSQSATTPEVVASMQEAGYEPASFKDLLVFVHRRPEVLETLSEVIGLKDSLVVDGRKYIPTALQQSDGGVRLSIAVDSAPDLGIRWGETKPDLPRAFLGVKKIG